MDQLIILQILYKITEISILTWNIAYTLWDGSFDSALPILWSCRLVTSLGSLSKSEWRGRRPYLFQSVVCLKNLPLSWYGTPASFKEGRESRRVSFPPFPRFLSP